MKTLIIILAILSIIIILPPIMYHQVYPTAGDDTASHLRYFKNIDSHASLYWGRYIVGKMINALPFDPNISFLWFNYISSAVMLCVIGICVSLAVSPFAGSLASMLVFGLSSATGLFYCGTIFDLIGIGILLPISLLCLHNRKKGIGWIIGAIISLASFTFFHANGKYILLLLPIVVVYEIVRWYFFKKLNGEFTDLLGNRYFMYMSPLVIVLLIGYMLDIVYPYSFRLYYDALILTMIVLGGFLGTIEVLKKGLVRYAVIAVLVLLSLPILSGWLQNNSAIRNADKEAIAYLNSLSGRTCAVSYKISEDIYGLFLNKQFVEIIPADYAVVRSVPMTPRSDIGSPAFVNQDRYESSENVYGYHLLREFNYGEKDRTTNLPIVVKVYEADTR